MKNRPLPGMYFVVVLYGRKAYYCFISTFWRVFMIDRFVHDICEALHIKEPAVSYDTSNFQTDTMMAQCDTSGSTIYIKKYDAPNPDQLFSIAHELRHIWQIQNDEDLYFSSYKPVELCSGVEEYNLQPAELDANAFAGLVMIRYFHLKPLFTGVPASVKEKVYDRMEVLNSVLDL